MNFASQSAESAAPGAGASGGSGRRPPPPAVSAVTRRRRRGGYTAPMPPPSYTIADYRALLEAALAGDRPMLVYEGEALRFVWVPDGERLWDAGACGRIELREEAGTAVVVWKD